MRAVLRCGARQRQSVRHAAVHAHSSAQVPAVPVLHSAAEDKSGKPGMRLVNRPRGDLKKPTENQQRAALAKNS